MEESGEWDEWGNYDNVLLFLTRYKLGKGYQLSIVGSIPPLILQAIMSLFVYSMMQKSCADMVNDRWITDSEDYQNCIDATNNIKYGWISVIFVPLSLIAAKISIVRILTINGVLITYCVSGVGMMAFGLIMALETQSLYSSVWGFLYFIDTFSAFFFMGVFLKFKRGNIELIKSDRNADGSVQHTAVHSYKKQDGTGYFAIVEHKKKQIIFKELSGRYYVKNNKYGKIIV